MASTYRSPRRRKQQELTSPLTSGDREDLKDEARRRVIRANALAAADRDPGKTGVGTPDAGGPALEGKREHVFNARHKEAEAQARRQYRQDKLGIKDLRTATAEQIAAAHGDEKALLDDESLVAQRKALARAQAQSQSGAQASRVDPGKPGIGSLGPAGDRGGKPAIPGRPTGTGGGLVPANAIRRARRRRTAAMG